MCSLKCIKSSAIEDILNFIDISDFLCLGCHCHKFWPVDSSLDWCHNKQPIANVLRYCLDSHVARIE